MASFSLSIALNYLNNPSMYPQYQGISGLTQLLADTSILVPGASPNATSLFYSGMLGDTHSGSVAEAIAAASDGKVITVQQSPQGQLLSSDAFQDAFKSAAQAAGYNELDATTLINGGTLTDGTRVIGGLWSNTSGAFAASSNNIISITPTAGQDSVWFDTELPTAIANNKSVNGISAAYLAGLSPSAAADLVNSASLGLVNNLQIATDAQGKIIGVDTGSTFSDVRINTIDSAPAGSALSTVSELLSGSVSIPDPGGGSTADPFVSPSDNGLLTGQNLTSLQDGALEFNNVIKAEGITLASLAETGLSTVAIGASWVVAANTAWQQVQSGDDSAAQKTMLNWTIDTEYGLAGGALAAEYAAPLLAGGPPGLVAYGLFVMAGGIAGSLVPNATRDLLNTLTDSSSSPDVSQRTDPDGSVWSELTYSNGLQIGQLTYSPPGVSNEYQETVTDPDSNGDGGYTKMSTSVSGTGADTQTEVYAPTSGQVDLQSKATTSTDASGNFQESVTNGAGNLTETITDTPKSGGGDVEVQSNLDSAGQVENTQNIDTQANGSVVDNVSGLGAEADLNGASINLSAGSSATISGSHNDVTADTNASVNLASGSSWDVVTMMKNGEVVLASADDDITVHATNSYVSMGMEDRVALDGSIIKVSGGVDNTVTTQGADEDVTLGTGSSLDVESGSVTANLSSSTFVVSSGSEATLTGSSDTVTDEANTTLALTGVSNNDTVTMSAGGSVSIASSDQGEMIYASGDAVLLGSNTTSTLIGNNDQVSGGTGNTVSVVGNDTVQGTSDLLYLGGNETVSTSGSGMTVETNANDVVVGSGDTVNVGGNLAAGQSAGVTTLVGSNDLVDATGDTLSVQGNDTVQGTSDLLYLGGNETVSTSGSGMTVETNANDVVVGSGDTVNVGGNLAAGQSAGVTTLVGSNDLVDATGDTLSVVGNDTVQGTSDLLYLGGNETVSTSGSGMTVETNANDVVVGSGDTVNVGGNLAAGQSAGVTTLVGSNDLVDATGDTLSVQGNDTVQGTSDLLYLGGNETVSTSGSGMTVETNANDVVVGSGDTVNVGGNLAAGQSAGVTTLVGSNDLVDATGDTLSVQGNDTVQGASDLLYLGGNETVSTSGSGMTVETNANDVVVGSGDTVNVGGNLAAGQSAGVTTLVGSNDLVDATGDTLSVQGNDTVQGTSDLLYLGGNETVSTSGSGMTVETSANDVVAGSGDTVNVGGNLLAGQSAGVTTLEGIGDKVYASADTLDIGGSTTATVVGSGDLIGILGSGSTINASSDTFQAISGVKDTIVGSHDVINDGLNDTITEMGTYDTTIGNSSDTTEHIGTDTGDTDSGDRPADPPEPDTNDPTTNPIEPPEPNHDDDSGGDLGFAGSKSTILSTTGSNIGFIARYVLSQDNQAAAVAAEKGLQQARDMAMTTPTVGSGSAVLEGAQFDQQVITWSLADSQGTQATPFSGYMDSTDESVVQGVFNTWAASMPGVIFEEVSDSAQSDIRVGFGDFNTATTGIIGYTSYQANDGQIAPDAIVRVEDPTQNALTTGADGQQTYVGTEATLSQVLLHEIGHALGLGDNADQNSVMNYQLTASNRTLDRTDLAGIGSLYGSGLSTTSIGSGGVSQLIQAMSTFNADAGVADTTLLPPALLNNNVTLSASAHAA